MIGGLAGFGLPVVKGRNVCSTPWLDMFAEFMPCALPIACREPRLRSVQKSDEAVS